MSNTVRLKNFLAIAITLLWISSCSPLNKAAKAAADNKKIMLLVVDKLFNQGDMATADMYFVPDFAKEEKAFTQQIRGAFPDLIISVEEMVAENDRVAARWVATGTHRGKFLGVEATGKKATWKGSWFWAFKNGIITDGMGKGSWDGLGLLKQLQSK
jgi:predicted ester cyclase